MTKLIARWDPNKKKLYVRRDNEWMKSHPHYPCANRTFFFCLVVFWVLLLAGMFLLFTVFRCLVFCRKVNSPVLFSECALALRLFSRTSKWRAQALPFIYHSRILSVYIFSLLRQWVHFCLTRHVVEIDYMGPYPEKHKSRGRIFHSSHLRNWIFPIMDPVHGARPLEYHEAPSTCKQLGKRHH